MKLEATYPTLEHQRAAETIVEFFVSNYQIDTVLLVNSCARARRPAIVVLISSCSPSLIPHGRS